MASLLSLCTRALFVSGAPRDSPEKLAVEALRDLADVLETLAEAFPDKRQKTAILRSRQTLLNVARDNGRDTYRGVEE